MCIPSRVHCILQYCRVWSSEHAWIAISGTSFCFKLKRTSLSSTFIFGLFSLFIYVLSISPPPPQHCDTFIHVELYGFSFYEFLYPFTLKYSVFSGHGCLMIYTIQFYVKVSDWKHNQILQQNIMCHFIPLAWKRLLAALILQKMVLAEW